LALAHTFVPYGYAKVSIINIMSAKNPQWQPYCRPECCEHSISSLNPIAASTEVDGLYLYTLTEEDW